MAAGGVGDVGRLQVNLCIEIDIDDNEVLLSRYLKKFTLSSFHSSRRPRGAAQAQAPNFMSAASLAAGRWPLAAGCSLHARRVAKKE